MNRLADAMDVFWSLKPEHIQERVKTHRLVDFGSGDFEILNIARHKEVFFDGNWKRSVTRRFADDTVANGSWDVAPSFTRDIGGSSTGDIAANTGLGLSFVGRHRVKKTSLESFPTGSVGVSTEEGRTQCD